MRLSLPRKFNWSIAVILGLVGILLNQGVIPLDRYPELDFWLVTIAFLILALYRITGGNYDRE